MTRSSATPDDADPKRHTTRDQVRAIFAAIAESTVIASASGVIVGFNAAAERLFGHTSADVLGRRIDTLMPESASWFDGGAPAPPDRRLEITARRRDGGNFPVEVLASRVAVSGETLTVAMVQDITERKRVARVQSELVATVGHDLRTPLASILGALQLVNGGNLSEARGREMLGIAERNGRRLMRLVSDLLDLERINAGMIPFTPAPTDLGAILRQCVDNHRPLTDAKAVRIAWSLPERPLRIMGDADRLAQIATNILANAVHFAPAGSAVEIRAAFVDGGIRVEIADRGPGVPPAFLPVMFDRFQQVASGVRRARDAASGSGLGLSIVRALVELHGGRVGAVSAPGVGTTVYFEIPCESAPSQ